MNCQHHRAGAREDGIPLFEAEKNVGAACGYVRGGNRNRVGRDWQSRAKGAPRGARAHKQHKPMGAYVGEAGEERCAS